MSNVIRLSGTKHLNFTPPPKVRRLNVTRYRHLLSSKVKIAWWVLLKLKHFTLHYCGTSSQYIWAFPNVCLLLLQI